MAATWTVSAFSFTFFDFELAAPSFGALGVLRLPDAVTFVFSAQVTVTLTCFADFCFGLPDTSQAGGLSGCQSGP